MSKLLGVFQRSYIFSKDIGIRQKCFTKQLPLLHVDMFAEIPLYLIEKWFIIIKYNSGQYLAEVTTSSNWTGIE